MRIPISDAQLEEDPYLPPYYHPGPDAPEIRYMLDRRRTLGGFLPERRTKTKALKLPGRDTYKALKKGSGNQEVATTMAMVRTFKELLRDKEIGPRIVPIIPDEARTFGMDSWFPSLKIYNRNGQLYTAVDAELMLAYKESEIGQILHEGINEAGSVGSFTAAGTSYATHNEPMIPIYIFYSMFGFQRTGDGLWAAADQMARGFVLGATAGRTTLTGEGLQHADGHSLLLAATNPAVVSYDPAFAFEIAYIVESGLARMFGENPENVYFYITIYNEPYVQPPEPENFDPEGVLRGIYRYRAATEQRDQQGADPGLRGGDARGAQGGGDAGRRVGRRRRRVVGDQLGRAEPRRRRHREGDGCAIPTSRPASPTSPRPSRTRAGRWSPSRTGCARSPSRSGRGCRAPTSRWAPTGSASPTPGPRLGATSTPTPNRRWSRCWRRWPATARSTRRWPSPRPASTRSTTCRPRRSRRRTPARRPSRSPSVAASCTFAPSVSSSRSRRRCASALWRNLPENRRSF